MKESINLSYLNTFNKVTKIDKDVSELGIFVSIESSNYRKVDIFLPKDKENSLEELILSFYVQTKLWDLHNKLKESESLTLMRNAHKFEDLVIFNESNSTYSYSSLLDLAMVPDKYVTLVKEMIIELNLDLIKLNYQLMGRAF